MERRMSGKKLRIGIIGMGWYAAADHVPNFRATGRAEIVAAARRDPQRLALALRELSIPQGFTDWREMLEKTKLDAVVVSTPHNYHVEPTLAALERGLHVLLEKPLATSIPDARTILRAAEQSDRVVMMGVNRRGDPSWQSAQRALASGQIGRVRQISAMVYLDNRVFREEISLAQPILQSLEGSELMKALLLDVPKADSWRRDPAQMGGDFFADVGSHLVDAMLWLGGAPAREVLAYQPKDRPQQASILSLQALLRNETILSITFNDNVAMGDDFTFAGDGHLNVFGDRGRLIAASFGWGGGGPIRNLTIERNGELQPLAVEGIKVHPAAAFVASILDGAPNPGSVKDAANVVGLIQSAYQSAAENRLVQIEEF
jgi:predicted dehydrogenase